MPILIKDVTGQKDPIELKAPVITNAFDPGQAQEILQFIDTLRWSRVTDVAAAEAERLFRNGYFEALGAYARTAFPGMTIRAEQDRHRLSMTSPDQIKFLFNDIVQLTHSALLSEVVIIPSNIYDAQKTEVVFHRPRYEQPYISAFGEFRFGFFQAFDKERQNSTTFATFTIDSKTIAPLLPCGADKLFTDLQSVMTLVNHDMLHHLTSPVIDSNVAHKNDHRLTTGLPIHGWANRVAHYWGETEPYEDWAQITQERVVLMNDPDGQKTKSHVENYFSELTRIRDEMMEKAKDETQKTAAREAVNYCALLMGHALLRVYPLNHSVMVDCVDRMTAVDPEPEATCHDAFFTVMKTGQDSRRRAEALSEYQGDQAIMRQLDIRFKRSCHILKVYGFGNLPEKIVTQEAKPIEPVLDFVDNKPVKEMFVQMLKEASANKENDLSKVTYLPISSRTLKLMILTQVSLVDVLSHVPQSSHGNIRRLQNDAAALTLDMLENVDKTLKATAVVQTLPKPK